MVWLCHCSLMSKIGRIMCACNFIVLALGYIAERLIATLQSWIAICAK